MTWNMWIHKTTYLHFHGIPSHAVDGKVVRQWWMTCHSENDTHQLWNKVQRTQIHRDLCFSETWSSSLLIQDKPYHSLEIKPASHRDSVRLFLGEHWMISCMRAHGDSPNCSGSTNFSSNIYRAERKEGRYHGWICRLDNWRNVLKYKTISKQVISDSLWGCTQLPVSARNMRNIGSLLASIRWESGVEKEKKQNC